jgi:hypothetical protein
MRASMAFRSRIVPAAFVLAEQRLAVFARRAYELPFEAFR